MLEHIGNLLLFLLLLGFLIVIARNFFAGERIEASLKKLQDQVDQHERWLHSPCERNMDIVMEQTVAELVKEELEMKVRIDSVRGSKFVGGPGSLYIDEKLYARFESIEEIPKLLGFEKDG